MSSNPSSPNVASIIRIAAGALQSRSVSVEPLMGYHYPTYRVTTASTARQFFYICKARPSNQNTSLRHEGNCLDREICVLQGLNNRPLIVPPKVVHYHSSPSSSGCQYLITGPFSGSILAQVEPNLSRSDLALIDQSLGRYINRMANVVGPGFGRVGQAPGQESSSWAKVFSGLLETVMADGENAALNLPFKTMRELLHKHRGSLDKITQPRLTLLELSGDKNIMVGQSDHVVHSLLDYSTAVWGDPFMCDCFVKPTTWFVEGFGRLPNKTKDEIIRQYFYVLYHAMVVIIRCHYATSSSSGLTEARQNLSASMHHLAVI
ncbi:hypothetical protein K470DRAFT_213205 [Piedraia hortae CBS 480.64]|uniref:Aminoglycoside phosphotransferase domain-containing protein n=1 Tax=Piedraia hortae CBS 480.64 TaxID=1314780 RepID=A0A6A7C4M7_9PEZI|nr:hypothetical protein K470DRAFT_213205 [Piedraia hortae CBS 480.64]